MPELFAPAQSGFLIPELTRIFAITMDIVVLLMIPVIIVWGMVLLLRCQWRSANLLPMLGLGVVLVGSVLGFEFFHLSGGPIPITLDRLLLAGLLGLCGVFYLRGSEHLRPLNRADVLVLALVAVNSFSALTHDWRFLDNMPASRLLFFYFIPVALYFVMRTVRMNNADLKWFAIVLSGFGIYLAVTAVFETRELSSLVFPRYIMNTTEMEFLGRGRGPFLNPVSNGIFMVICCCCLWMNWTTSSQRGKLWIMGLTAIMAAGIFCTLTRSIWMGFIASAAVFIWYPASRQTKGALVIAATVMAIVAFPIVGEKIFSFKRDKQVTVEEMENSAALRPLFAMVAWKMFQDRPVFGCGFGQYAREKYPYLQDPHSGMPLSATKLFMQHNIFLAYLTELGLVGLSVLLVLLSVMGYFGWDLWRDPELPLWPRMFGMLLVVMLINYSINGMFHDVSIIPMQNILLMFLFGVVNNIRTARESFEMEFIPASFEPAPEQASATGLCRI